MQEGFIVGFILSVGFALAAGIHILARHHTASYKADHMGTADLFMLGGGLGSAVAIAIMYKFHWHNELLCVYTMAAGWFAGFAGAWSLFGDALNPHDYR